MKASLQCSRLLKSKHRIQITPQAIAIRLSSSKVSSSLLLPPPSLIFSNHHLLVVDKPPGWRSIPLDGGDYKSREDGQKCLLTYLKNQGLGGGSLKDYLKPVHRLDQPCSGLTVFAKNSKAASRIQKAWAKRNVHKEYYCVVETDDDSDAVFGRDWGDDEWQDETNIFVLSGLLQKRLDGKGSVWVKTVEHDDTNTTHTEGKGDKEDSSKQSRGTLCHLAVRHIASVSSGTRGIQQQTPRHLLAVRTVTGMRHQIRAMLSHVGKCPIVGDLRYGASKPPLQDQSVALHAKALFMPTVKLGGTEFLATEPFVAPIPTTWERYFGMRESDLRQ
ncbi:MAG: hypothetical protein SGARI_000919 [Bacillariaceae sp.]